MILEPADGRVMGPQGAPPDGVVRRAWMRAATSARRLSVFDSAVVCAALAIVLVALIGPLFAPDVYSSDILAALQPPSAEHWFGTDQQGRDVFWRVVVGARVSIGAAVLVVIGYGAIGAAVACAATVGPRWIDEALMRFTDVGLAFPSLVFALALAASLGSTLTSAMIALLVTGWPLTARLLRGVIRDVMSRPFIEGAIVLGVGRYQLMARHVLPNAIPPLLVKWTGDIGNTVLVIGALSFVGAGAQPPSAEWGAMVSSARGLVSTAWWTALFPGLAIAITTAVFGLLGDRWHGRLSVTGSRRGQVSHR